jgi:hypothetical protein
MRNATLAVTMVVLCPFALGAQGAPGRVRPPAAVTCDRNDLTVYTGRVTSWERKSDSTSLTIATDWKTTEHVVIKHQGADAAASFLLKGGVHKRGLAAISTDGN